VQTKPSNRIRPRDLGRRFVLQQGDPHASTEGYEVIANQHSLDTLKGDVATIKRRLQRVGSPAILIGHSHGRTLFTAAERMTASPAWSTSLNSLPMRARRRRASRISSARRTFSLAIKVADGRVWMRPDGVVTFPGNSSEQEQKIVRVTHIAPASNVFDQTTEITGWKSKPSWCTVATKDRTVQPALQRVVAKRIHATTRQVDSSHVPTLSNPTLVLDVIRTAANAIQKAAAAQGM